MDRMLLNIPDCITTERLLIRPARAGDGAAINEAIRESLEALRPWMAWAQTCPTIEQSEILARRSFANFHSRDELPLRLFLRDTGDFVGASVLHRINWDVPAGEIGYWLRRSAQGKGFMTEAVRAVTRFGFEIGLQRIEIRCDPRNVRSIRVAERAGFALEATLRCNALDPHGRPRDTAVYSRIASS